MCCSPERGFSRRAAIRSAALTLASSLLPASELRVLKPVDEAGQDPALAALLDRMRKSIAARDLPALTSLMTADFRVEFDAGKGPVAFRKHWRPDQQASRLWDVLGRVLLLGGSFYSDTLFGAPYVFTRFPHDLDILGHVVATGDATLFQAASPDARALGTAAHEILPVAEPFRPPVILSPTEFVALRHPSLGPCFAPAAQLYSPAGHRVFFEKIKGQWRWISLAAATLADPPELKGRS